VLDFNEADQVVGMEILNVGKRVAAESLQEVKIQMA